MSGGRKASCGPSSAPLREVLLTQLAAYPRMESADCLKLVYQNEFGPGHMIHDSSEVLPALREEWELLRHADETAAPAWRTETIGNGLCRVHLDSAALTEQRLPLLARLVCATAKTHRGSEAAYTEKLELLRTLTETEPGFPDAAAFGAALRAHVEAGCLPVHHSEAYRRAYRPHYRVVKAAYLAYWPVLEAVQTLAQAGRPAVVAIDGRCAAGKTFLAFLLEELFGCPVFHMDSFFLPMESRTKERLAEPGGNMDFPRFRDEVLCPLADHREVRYRPYDCGTNTLGEEVRVPPGTLSVVEGSFSLHPALGDGYDLRVFLTCTRQVQEKRLRRRESPAMLQCFLQEWVPAEERYFATYDVAGRCHVTVDTSRLF